MSWAKLGLRSKALLALSLAFFLTLLPSVLIGWQILLSAQKYLGEAYARNQAELGRQRIITPVLQELVLSQRLAESLFTRDWLLDETNPNKKQRFFAEAAAYQRAFQDHALFLINAQSLNYYYNTDEQAFSDAPRYRVLPDNPENAWFFNIIQQNTPYNINVNIDVHLQTTRVWVNVPVRDRNRIIGLAGTGMDLTHFVKRLIENSEVGVTNMILTEKGHIQAHPDLAKISLGAGAGVGDPNLTLLQFVPPEQVDVVLATLRRSAEQPDQIALAAIHLDGSRHLLAVAFIPELNWYLASAINLSVAELVDREILLTMALIAMMVIAVLILAVLFAVNRVVIRPLLHLQRSASAIAQGQYDVYLPKISNDEIGALAKAFSSMSDTIRRHTMELESKVQERTRDLENSNREIATINKKINDSIDYASLIQRAILPDSSLQRLFQDQYFVLWRPRDIVGGDFYFLHSAEDCHLLGLVDCAGHGVPGALMTMLARAAFDHAIREVGLSSPAKILHAADQLLRTMLQDFELPKALATNMDVALLVLQPETGQLIFSGAKLSLYVVNGEHIEEIPGAKPALLARRSGEYQDTRLIHHNGQCYYLSTDGYVDQAGGSLGYGLGNQGWLNALKHVADLPIAQQGGALYRYLQTWQTDQYPQRDDISVLGFTWPVLGQ